MVDCFAAEAAVEAGREAAWDGPGVLDLQNPGGESDAYEWLNDPEGVAAAVAPARDALIRGDVRPLAIAWFAGLATRCDEDGFELPPVPAGLDALTPALEAVRAFFEVSESEVAGLAEGGPAGPPREAGDEVRRAEAFVRGLAVEDLRAVASRLLAGDAAGAEVDLRRCLREAEPPAA